MQKKEFLKKRMNYLIHEMIYIKENFKLKRVNDFNEMNGMLDVIESIVVR